MRILLDENLDWRLGRDLPGHKVESVPRIGWAGITNGELLTRAASRFDVLLTMDAGFVDQLNPANYDLAVVVLRAHSNRLADTSPLMPNVLIALETIQPGTVTEI